MPFKFNPLTANLDLVNTSGGSPTVVEYQDSDPSSPTPGDLWVKHTNASSGGTGGTPIGLLLSLTYAGTITDEKYELSYQTSESTIIRTTMS